MDAMKTAVAVLTLLLWLAFVGISFYYLQQNWPMQDKFVEFVEKVLMPLLKFTIGASLTYVFGKPVSEGVKSFLDRRL